ncbi:uncharacterized protein LOC131605421 [Vicia villosa]|uniref:uncharacterized protein LOC131605421 n=1 Tax=Vicia villosa TaxID=3911 RepID=UPI00273C3598|nr:uncharacterized protein LOC131605421 [Vicia villosa]
MAPKIWDLLWESKCIIYTQPRHYLILSLIFLLRLSLSSPYFSNSLPNIFYSNNPLTSHTNIISLSTLISSIFTNSAFISITSSVYIYYFNQPIKLKEVIKSISTSFFPLLATDIVIFIIFFISVSLSTLVVIVISFLLAYLGDNDLQAHPYLAVVLSMLVFLPHVTYLMINLSLVKVIVPFRVVVVVESVWGLEPLRRSWKLVKGMKMLIFSIFCLFEFLQWMLVSITGYSWVLILAISPIRAMLSLYDIVVFTVLYIYCKEKRGELGDGEFGKGKDGASLACL